MIRPWRPMRPWLLLGVAAAAVPVAGMIARLWLPTGSAAVVGVVAAVVTALAAQVAEAARGDLSGRAQRRRQVASHVLGASRRGRLPTVRACDDPILLGVHPATALGTGRVPPFIPRDIDAQLRAALRRSALVVLVGESAAGKSRAAYEAMRATLPDHTLVQPVGVGALEALAPVVAEQRRCVLWLDDLDQYLNAGGLSSQLLATMLGGGDRHAVVLATMRTYHRARYDPARESGLDDAGRQVWLRGRAVIERAQEIRLERRWSPAELDRARTLTDDPRIVQAIHRADRFGVAEVLAAGPELVNRLHDAWTPGQHPRAAALVTAAVDLRRGGLDRPAPQHLLITAHETYLSAHGGPDLRPEPLEAALAFATETVYATTSLLLPDGTGRYLAHDYIVDALPDAPIPDTTWQALLGQVSAGESYHVGMAAFDAYRFDHARAAFTRAADAAIDDARHMLGLTVGTAGRPDLAIDIMRQVLADRTRRLGHDHPDTLAARYDLAVWAADGGAVDEAVTGFRRVLADQTRVLGRDHPATLATRHNLYRWMGESGDVDAALLGFRQVLADRTRRLGPDHPDTLATRHNLAYWTGVAGDVPTAIGLLTHLLDDSVRVLGPDHPDTLAARHNLARWSGEDGDVTRAVAALERLLADRIRVLGPEHPDTLGARHEVALWTGASGDAGAARDAFRVLLADRIRVLGPDHPDTAATRRQLAHWTGATAAPDSDNAGDR